jgi:hypothetical protein
MAAFSQRKQRKNELLQKDDMKTESNGGKELKVES